MLNAQDKKDAIEKVARLARGARKQLNYSQVEVAQALGMSQSALSKVEAGLLTFDPLQWYQFCQLVNIQPDQSWYTGYIDRCVSKDLEDGTREGGFRIPERYARMKGTKVRAIRPFLNYFRKTQGATKLSAYLESVKMDEDFFITLDNQLNVDFNLDITRTMINKGILKRKNIAELANVYRKPIFHGSLSQKYQTAASQANRFIQLADTVKHYDVNCEYQFERLGNEFIEVSITPREHLREFNYKDDTLQDCLCHYKKEVMKAFALFGEDEENQSPVEIHELECHFTSHSPKCVYRIEVAS